MANTQSHQATVSVGFTDWGTKMARYCIFYVNDLPNALDAVHSVLC